MSKHIQHEEKLETVTKQSNISTLLNGVGSGVMVAGGLAYIAKFAGKAIGPDFPFGKHFESSLAFASVTGAVIGAMYSFKEAKQLNDYRQALANDVAKLHKQVDRLEAQHGR